MFCRQLARKEEGASLVKLLDTASTSYRMQISTENIKFMTNNANSISTDIKVDSKKLEIVHSFKYLGAIMSDEWSKPELLSRIAQTTTALNKLNTIWNDKNISRSSKTRVVHSTILLILLYACETWILTADIKRRIQATEMRCFPRLLGISYRDHITNMEEKSRIEQALDPTKTFWPQWKTANLCGADLSPNHLVLLKHLCKVWCKEAEKGDRKEDGKTTSGSGQVGTQWQI